MPPIRSWWADRPIVGKLAAIVVVALVTIGALVSVGVDALASAATRTDQLNALNGLTRQALEADMAHDAIRGTSCARWSPPATVPPRAPKAARRAAT